MIMADVFKILFLILGMLLCTVSYWLMFQALFSGSVERCRTALLARPYRVFMTGVLIGVPVFLFGAILLSNGAGPLKFLGGAILVAQTTLALFGSTGLIRHIGEQLSDRSVHSRPGLTVLRGGAVVFIACVLPIVGWFLLIPVVLIAGFGAGIRLLWARRAVSAAPVVSQAVQA